MQGNRTNLLHFLQSLITVIVLQNAQRSGWNDEAYANFLLKARRGEIQIQGATAYTFTETDTASTCAVNVYCSGRSLTAGTKNTRQATNGGSAGSTGVPITIGNGETDVVGVNFELPVNSGVTWAAGTWTI